MSTPGPLIQKPAMAANPTPLAVASSERLIVPGPKVLLVGGTGSGKTHALRTILESGQKLFTVFTEPGMEVMLDDRFKVYTCAEGMHWCYLPPATVSWAQLEKNAKLVNTMSLKSLSEMSDINKAAYSEFYKLVGVMNNLVCDRCKQNFGPSDKLGEDWCVANDSLSGISTMAMNLVVGGKPVAAKPDWGIAMKMVETYITKFTGDIQCMAVMIAHLERETDETTGAILNMPSTLGQKLSPKIGRNFSDILHAKRDLDRYAWSTATVNTDLKSRHFTLGENHPPSFKPIVESWRRKLQAARDAGEASKATQAMQATGR